MKRNRESTQTSHNVDWATSGSFECSGNYTGTLYYTKQACGLATLYGQATRKSGNVTSGDIIASLPQIITPLNNHIFLMPTALNTVFKGQILGKNASSNPATIAVTIAPSGTYSYGVVNVTYDANL